MKSIRLISILFAAATGTALMTAPVNAGADMQHQFAAIQLAGNAVNAKQAAKRAQRQTGGRVLSVKLKNADSSQPYYAVKVIKDGKVSIVNIPAN